jgi:hypothetical protein
MARRRADRAVSGKNHPKIDAQPLGRRIFVFRCNETCLWAFTMDREGGTLPSQMYPQITWRFEQALTFRLRGSSSRKKILRAMLDGVAERGFHLIHAAIYGELLGLILEHSASLH